MTRAIFAAAIAAANVEFKMPLASMSVASLPRYVMSEMTKNEIACATATAVGKRGAK
jgi:hypothetical protein